MLKSLFIKNYRNLKLFKINALGRVNLITGKNNTGKSSLLEAIAIYAGQGDLSFVYQSLTDRGENFKLPETNKNYTDFNIQSFASMFTNRLVGLSEADFISIGPIENTLFGEESSQKSVTIRFINYIDEDQTDSQGNTTRKRTILKTEAEKQPGTYKVGLQVLSGIFSYILSLENDRSVYNRLGFRGFGRNEAFQFIGTRNVDKEINGRLWDNITLTEKEEFVIDALRIIEPSVEKIAFIEESKGKRATVVKLAHISGPPIPILSMGDGINRILTIILALVNSDNGFLLIDEFENGLHHSVQEQLWDIIFSLSQKLNVQVFATTHSEDCISGFQNALNDSQHSFNGKLIRLDNINDVIKQVEFDAQELKIAGDNEIDIR